MYTIPVLLDRTRMDMVPTTAANMEARLLAHHRAWVRWTLHTMVITSNPVVEL
jgi:hypothetical protein